MFVTFVLAFTTEKSRETMARFGDPAGSTFVRSSAFNVFRKLEASTRAVSLHFQYVQSEDIFAGGKKF